MATSRVLALMAQEEKEHLVEPCEVEAPGKPWLGRLSRLGAFLVAGLVLLAIVPLPGGLHDWLEGLQDPNLRSLQIELQAAGLPLPFEQKSHISSEAGSVLCVVDVAQSVGRIMGIATSIKGATVNCDYKRIEREEKRPVTKDERQRCAVTIIGVLVNTALGIGAMSSSISTCAGSVNVPANCAANINAFIGNALVLVATAMAADLSCPEDPLPDRIEAKAKEIADAKEEAAREVNDWLKEHGQDYKVLPPSPAVPKDVVYTNIARCVGSLDLAVTFVMKSAVIIADSTVDCSEIFLTIASSMPRLAPQEVAWLEKMLPQDAMLPSSHLQLAMPKMHRPQRVATFFQTHGAQGEEIHAEGITSELRPFVAQDTRSIYARKFFSSFQEKQVVCAINMRERYPGMQTKRCCEEASEASCLACCQEHFASRGEKCVEVCGTMCAFGWDKGNRKVPQCPEKLGSEDGGAEEWYAEDPMKDRPRPAVPDKKLNDEKKVERALSLGF